VYNEHLIYSPDSVLEELAKRWNIPAPSQSSLAMAREIIKLPQYEVGGQVRDLCGVEAADAVFERNKVIATLLGYNYHPGSHGWQWPTHPSVEPLWKSPDFSGLYELIKF
jgi:hypothetical protein